MSTAEDVIRVARKVQPKLWERTEQVARIIDPAAFMDGWTTHDSDSTKVLNARLKYQQAVALHRAQEVLRYLGVNCDADWYAILGEIAKESNGE